MMTRIVCLGTALVAGLATGHAGTPAPITLAAPQSPPGDVPIRVSHRARALTPGEIVLVTAQAALALKDVRAEWRGQTILFYQADAMRWEGLAPIDLATPAGRYTLRLDVRTGDGRTMKEVYPITVSPKTFPTRRIRVDEKFAAPPENVLPRIKQEQMAAEAIFATVTPERFWSEPFIVPVPGEPTSSFGRRSVVNGQPRSPHSGSDFHAATGTPVVAPNRGRVALAADHYFPGLTIILDHGAGVYSYLAHLSEFTVAEGAIVERGQQIALSGASGRVTGPHLHWTLRLGKARVDPLSLVSVLASAAGKHPQ